VGVFAIQIPANVVRISVRLRLRVRFVDLRWTLLVIRPRCVPGILRPVRLIRLLLMVSVFIYLCETMMTYDFSQVRAVGAVVLLVRVDSVLLSPVRVLTPKGGIPY